ncbi:hypothetical protein NAV11_00775 [Pseudomonas songnenensis]|uniref:DUF695 domain-containing protein n=1 Tax=Pseudomonas songnenensis TaxID=1176259 RepID=A0ABX9UTU6_9PSED|nr:hypothetical protein [Pseudomonas songnenensis]MCQ4298431.1 hypothetical protein [Pseudomonas songnenensis]RMH96731.1 hypothetical protein EA798_10015 [Pseudomonas songnenensis]
MRIALVFLFLVLGGCANIWRMDNGPLTAFSESVRESPDPRNTMVWIDLQKKTDTRVLAAQIKLAEQAPLVAIGTLRPEFVAQFLPPWEPPPQWPEIVKQKARQDDNYQGGGIYVSFRQGRLVYVSLVSQLRGERFYPQVAAPASSELLSLPLSRAQMEAVFGPPRRVYRVSEVRY